MAPRYDTPLRNTRMTALVNLAASPAYLRIYNGTAPLPSAPATGTLLVSMPMATPQIGSVSGGTLTMGTITPTNGVFSAVPTYGRITNSLTDDGTHTVVQLTAGVASGDLNFSGQIYNGGQVSCSSFTITEGNP